MERNSNGREWEKMKKELNELMIEGRDYAHQLKSHLGSDSSQESREHLAKKVLESYHKSLTIMNYSGELDQVSPTSHGGGTSKSDDSDHQVPHNIQSSKNSMPRWTQKVRIAPGVVIDRALDDGFSWRKYGQKDILGAKFPRGYHRCTYRKSQGCEATKQVQRSNEDPMLFEIMYKGIHTCSQASNFGSTIPVQVLEPNQTQEQETLEIVKTNLDTGHHNYNHQPLHLQPTPHYHLPSALNLESNNVMPQQKDHNIGFLGSTSYSDLGNNVNYDFLAPHDGGSASHSTSNSPTTTVGLESPFESFGPSHPFEGFGGFYP